MKRWRWLALVIPAAAFFYWMLTPVFYEGFKISETVLNRDGGKVYITGKITNLQNQPVASATIEAKLFDINHHDIGTSRVEVKNIPAKGTVPFKSEPVAIDGAESFLVKVSTFQNPYGN